MRPHIAGPPDSCRGKGSRRAVTSSSQSRAANRTKEEGLRGPPEVIRRPCWKPLGNDLGHGCSHIDVLIVIEDLGRPQNVSDLRRHVARPVGGLAIADVIRDELVKDQHLIAVRQQTGDLGRPRLVDLASIAHHQLEVDRLRPLLPRAGEVGPLGGLELRNVEIDSQLTGRIVGRVEDVVALVRVLVARIVRAPPDSR